MVMEKIIKIIYFLKKKYLQCSFSAALLFARLAEGFPKVVARLMLQGAQLGSSPIPTTHNCVARGKATVSLSLGSSPVGWAGRSPFRL